MRIVIGRNYGMLIRPRTQYNSKNDRTYPYVWIILKTISVRGFGMRKKRNVCIVFYTTVQPYENADYFRDFECLAKVLAGSFANGMIVHLNKMDFLNYFYIL